MIKVVIFDLDGVLIYGRFMSDRFEERFGVPKEEFLLALKQVTSKAKLSKADNSFVYWQSYLEKWKVNLTKDDFFNFWFGDEKVSIGMIELIKNLKKKDVRIFILSDNFKERTDHLEQKFTFFNQFIDKTYYSWKVGFLKSDPRAFQKVLSDNDLKPEECLYFDDDQENVDVADRLGIKSFLFKEAKQVKRILEENNL